MSFSKSWAKLNAKASSDPGSEAIYHSARMFDDATKPGGGPEEAGRRYSLPPMSINSRKRRPVLPCQIP